MKQAVQLRFDIQLYHHLGDTVRDRGHPEESRAATFLGYLDLLDGRWKIGTRRHPVPDPIEISLKIGLEHLNGLIVDARSAPIGFHAPISFQYHMLRDPKRLCRCHGFIPI